MKNSKSILISLIYIYIINFSNLFPKSYLKSVNFECQQFMVSTNELCEKLKTNTFTYKDKIVLIK